MPDREFLFGLELSDEPHFDAMLRDLAGAVLAHVGYDEAAIEELRGVLRTALTARGANGRCRVHFRVSAGELQISVAFAGAAEWRTTRPLP